MPQAPGSMNKYAPGTVHEMHEHADTQISLLLNGSLEEHASGQDHVAQTLEVCIKRAGVLHSDRFGPEGATLFQIRLPQDLEHELECAQLSLPDWEWFGPGPATAAMLRISKAPSDRVVEDLHDLLAAIIPWPGREAAKPAPWLIACRDHIVDKQGQGLSVKRLAEETGVHPVHLSRSFKRWVGSSIGVFIQREKARAASKLILAGQSLTHAAMDTGYSDQAHLTRSFRKYFGVTPGYLRRLAADV